MHECPECGQACDCIGDDTWDDTEAMDCTHECEDLDEDEYDYVRDDFEFDARREQQSFGRTPGRDQ